MKSIQSLEKDEIFECFWHKCVKCNRFTSTNKEIRIRNEHGTEKEKEKVCSYCKRKLRLGRKEVHKKQFDRLFKAGFMFFK
jgi:hypothetical protein